jgi:hypothetical protein
MCLHAYCYMYGHGVTAGMALINDKTFQMRVSEAFLHRVEDWRKSHPVIPSRSDAFRQLIDRGLASSAPAAAVPVASLISLSESLDPEFTEGRLQTTLEGIRSDEVAQVNVKISARLNKVIDRMSGSGAKRFLIQEMLIEGVNQRLCALGMKPLTF